MIEFLCTKIGMDYIYNRKGKHTPVTIVSVYNNYIFKLFKSLKNYFFILSFYNNFKVKLLKQFKVCEFDFIKYCLLDCIPLNILYINQNVKIRGISIGKGFSGVIKKHNFNSNYATHGNSKAHNKPGSIGMCQDPGRVLPGKKMAGRQGCKKIFLKNLKILKIDFFYRLIYLGGSIPGFDKSDFMLTYNL